MFARVVEQHQAEAFEGMEAAKAYVERTQDSTLRYRAFLSRLKPLGIQGRVLDVGAGNGEVAAILADGNPQVEITALEISADMAAVGREMIKKRHLDGRIEFILGDAKDRETIEQLGHFDLVFSTFSLHHWEHPRKVIANLASALKDDGVLFIYDLRRVWWLYWVPNQNGFFKSIRAAYVRREIKEMLRGFPSNNYEINYEFPFLLSIILRKPQ